MVALRSLIFAVVVSQLSGFMMTLKGLPSTYNKDLQEDKEPMFDAADTLSRSIRILEGVVSTLTVRPIPLFSPLSSTQN